ncbi:uncharacterized protein LOC126888504 [Diabrotica virgifera virgifera]|uniref:RNase H type-1 domain-containing protein n=1 Tax=Diabrotica virgifera virgifera TaxID=50390 RepID=A0ABM5KRI7_DIAVI|nr:uncharacterized protein LOC126888504 [Diabrotica virgifera virgifera]
MAFRNTSPHNSALKRPISVDKSEFFDMLEPLEINIPVYHENLLISKNTLSACIANLPDFLEIYTDASKQNDGTGCAFYIPSANIQEKFKLNSSTSIFSAEAIGIIKACEYIEKSKLKKIHLLSDSLSVLKCIANPINVVATDINPFIKKLKLKIHKLRKSHYELKFTWVKAHIGLRGNEVVDSLAKESLTTGQYMENNLGAQEYLTISKRNFKEKWELHWKKYCGNCPTRYTLLHSSIPTVLWHQEYDFTRNDTVTICRLKFGHASFPQHLYRIGVVNTELCETCNVVSDLDHIFYACSKF